MPAPDKFTPPQLRRDTWRDMLRKAKRTLQVGAFSLMVGIATQTVFRVLRRRYQRRLDRGETIWLDELAGPPVRQVFDLIEYRPADLAPREGKARQARHMKVPYPSTDYRFAYKTPPPSGNAINGLGEATPRRADYVFFGDGYMRAWGKLDWYFQIMEPSNIHRLITRLFWEDRHRVGPVARSAKPFVDEDAASSWLKDVAREAGASLVGITELQEHMRYRDFDQPWRHAIAIGIPMDREDMVHTPSNRSGVEIQQAYLHSNAIAIAVAKRIRARGFAARASTNISPDATEVLHIPIAIAAGLGQLGKHGSLITREHGSNVRLAIVLTDLPLTNDAPVDIGVDDFCASCRVCATNCPPFAISPTKQTVRGVEKWYVDFDACVPYFAETHGCGICIQVCPWSEQGRGFKLSDRLMKRREQPLGPPAAA